MLDCIVETACVIAERTAELSCDIAKVAALEILEKPEATIGADIASCMIAAVAIVAELVIAIN